MGAEADEKVKALEAELDGMEKTKENKKKITEMGKEINAIKKAGQYTDALKVIKVRHLRRDSSSLAPILQPVQKRRRRRKRRKRRRGLHLLRRKEKRKKRLRR